MTVKQALAKGTSLLKAPCETALIDTPSLDARLLLTETLSISPEELVVRGDEPISCKDYEKFSHLLSRRLRGECIAYILGRKEFRLLEFTVNPHVLVPRPDTETLVEAALSYIDIFTEQGSHETSLLDLCTGSGAVAISLKYERPQIKVTASDISKEALKIATENARLNLDVTTSSTICSTKYGSIVFIESNLFSKITGKFNVIVCNPPYIPSSELSALPAEVHREPKLALDGGEDGLKLIRKIIPEAKKHLLPKGVLLLEADPRQMATIRKLLESNNYKKIRIYRDLSGKNRVISGASS